MELVGTPDLGSGAEMRESSSLSWSTKKKSQVQFESAWLCIGAPYHIFRCTTNMCRSSNHRCMGSMAKI